MLADDVVRLLLRVRVGGRGVVDDRDAQRLGVLRRLLAERLVGAPLRARDDARLRRRRSGRRDRRRRVRARIDELDLGPASDVHPRTAPGRTGSLPAHTGAVDAASPPSVGRGPGRRPARPRRPSSASTGGRRGSSGRAPASAPSTSAATRRRRARTRPAPAAPRRSPPSPTSGRAAWSPAARSAAPSRRRRAAARGRAVGEIGTRQSTVRAPAQVKALGTLARYGPRARRTRCRARRRRRTPPSAT